MIEWRIHPDYQRPYQIAVDQSWTRYAKEGTPADVDRLNQEAQEFRKDPDNNAGRHVMEYRFKEPKTE